MWERFYELMVANGMAPPPFPEWFGAIDQDNAELWPVMRAGKTIGGVLFIGQTVHIAIDPEWHGRWITADMRRALGTWAHPGEVIGLIRPDNQHAIEFAKRLGFHFAADQGIVHRYVRPPHEHQPH